MSATTIASPIRHVRPLRVDYVLITANANETRAARDVLGLRQLSDEDGLRYYWGQIATLSGYPCTVAVVSLYDKQGGTVAATAAQLVLQVLAPAHVLILGTAGGISLRRRTPLRPGDIVIPRVVHTGTLKDVSLRELPIQQPSPSLYATAFSVAQVDDDQWRKYVADGASGKSRPPKGFRPIVTMDADLVSTDVNIKGIGSPLLKRLLQEFPRLTAVEMETGGIAHYLHEAAELLRGAPASDYLVIKGISDTVYDEAHHEGTMRIAADLVDSLLEKCGALDDSVVDGVKRTLEVALAKPRAREREANQAERDQWSSPASRYSAAFARRLIEVHEGQRRPIPYIRLSDRVSREGILSFDGNVRTLLGINPETYSRLAVSVLDRLLGHFDDKLDFFTVCAFNPTRLYRLLLERYKVDYQTDEAPTLEQLTSWAKHELRHFARFAQHAKNRKERCARVLVLDNLPRWPTEVEHPCHWELFKSLNGDVPCWAIDRPSLKRVGFITDYVILGERILLDWYDDAGVLNVGDMDRFPGSEYFSMLLQDFMEHREGGFPYERLESLDARVTAAFQTVDA